MNLKSDIFQIAYRIKTNTPFLYEDVNSLKDFHLIKSPCFCWAADPFPFKINGKKYILAEIAFTISGKGRIGVVCLDDKRPKWKIISNEKFHMSFPNVVFIHDNLYILPETYQDKCLALYKIGKDFRLSKYKVLNKIDFCVDTIYIKNSFECYFSYEAKNHLSNDFELVWRKASDASKISSIKDYKNELRPAGNIFFHHNKMLFPSQDCKYIYGGGIIFNELLINEKEKKFSINKIFELTGNDVCKQMHIENAVGCHTYNFNDNIEVIDILIRRFSLLGLFYKIINRLKKN